MATDRAGVTVPISGRPGRLTIQAALLGLLLAVAACSTPAGSSQGSGESPPSSEDGTTSSQPSGNGTGGLCDAVPAAEVEAVLGGSSDGGVPSESSLTGHRQCRFTRDAEHVLDVSLGEQTRDDWFEAITTVGMDDEAVSGVGEEAYRAAETALGGPGGRFTAWAAGTQVGMTAYSDVDQQVIFDALARIATALLAGS